MVLHRDIKPDSNIDMFILAREGDLVVEHFTDFGIAYAVGSAPVTVTGAVMGTPGYLAPERIDGAQAGPAKATCYASSGIVAYECLAGARPFAGPPLEVAIERQATALIGRCYAGLDAAESWAGGPAAPAPDDVGGRRSSRPLTRPTLLFTSAAADEPLRVPAPLFL